VTNFILNIRKSAVARSARVLSPRDRKRIFAVIILQVLFGLLDLAGVAIIGVLGALAVAGIGPSDVGDRVNTVLKLLNIDQISFQSQVLVLGLLAGLLLVGRTIFSIIFTRRILSFLANRGAQVASDLITKLLTQDITSVQKKTTQETVYLLTSGVNAITIGIVGVVANLVSDISLLLILSAGMIYVDPGIAVSTFVVFGVIAFSIYKLINQKVLKMGEENAHLSIVSNEMTVEVLSSYRELFVGNRRGHYAAQISEARFKLAKISAGLSFIPYVSKYIIETTMVVSALIISGIQFQTQDAVRAVATLSVFLAAGTRIIPALLRVQQGAISIKSSIGAAAPTLDLLDSLENIQVPQATSLAPVFTHGNFSPDLILEDVEFKYPNSDSNAIEKMNLNIKAGSFVAIVGPSGAGKTTLVDLMLGVLRPHSGKVLISGLDPEEAINKWPGAVSYVPQNVSVANGTVASNVTMGFEYRFTFSHEVIRALNESGLGEFATYSGIQTVVGENGSKLSGGQRQRLGIARSLFTNPNLLVLDEATSALDAETEKLVSDWIKTLKGKVTVVVVAHRLSTVRTADVVVYIQNGKIVHRGSFEEIRQNVSNFDKQAKLMGL
jgi:ABC-type multidrug transport system fused ATPase/permease subunit